MPAALRVRRRCQFPVASAQPACVCEDFHVRFSVCLTASLFKRGQARSHGSTVSFCQRSKVEGECHVRMDFHHRYGVLGDYARFQRREARNSELAKLRHAKRVAYFWVMAPRLPRPQRKPSKTKWCRATAACSALMAMCRVRPMLSGRNSVADHRFSPDCSLRRSDSSLN
jgi:hypothetical protein